MNKDDQALIKDLAAWEQGLLDPWEKLLQAREKLNKDQTYSFSEGEIFDLGYTLTQIGHMLIQVSDRMSRLDDDLAKLNQVGSLTVLHTAMHGLFTAAWNIREEIQDLCNQAEKEEYSDNHEDEIYLKSLVKMLPKLKKGSTRFEKTQREIEELRQLLIKADQTPDVTDLHWDYALTPPLKFVSDSFTGEHELIRDVCDIYLNQVTHHIDERQKGLSDACEILTRNGKYKLFDILNLPQHKMYNLLDPHKFAIFYGFLESYGYSWKYRGNSQHKYPSHRFAFSETHLRNKHEKATAVEVMKNADSNARQDLKYVFRSAKTQVRRIRDDGRVSTKWYETLISLIKTHRVFPEHLVFNSLAELKIHKNVATALSSLSTGEAVRADLFVDEKTRLWTDAFNDCFYYRALHDRKAVPQGVGEKEFTTSQFLVLLIQVLYEWYAHVEMNQLFESYYYKVKTDAAVVETGPWLRWNKSCQSRDELPMCWYLEDQKTEKVAEASVKLIPWTDHLESGSFFR
tara:strand:- start:329 stop:1870 length:1542 start_codon:yes stop_codon:yes gene_type:complete